MEETKICSKCNIEQPVTEIVKGKRHCRKCESKRYKEYYQRTREARIAYVKEYYQQNKEDRKEYHRKRREENREKVLEINRKSNRKYKKNNREKIREQAREYDSRPEVKERKLEKERESRKENPSLFRERSRKWRENNLDKTRYYKRKRRALSLLVDEDFTVQNEQTILDVYEHKCFRCGNTYDDDRMCLDHTWPLSKGYAMTLNNCTLLCNSCNSSKSDKDPEVFYTDEEMETLKEKYNQIQPSPKFIDPDELERLILSFD